jgi:hypothetical protein
LEAEDLRCRYDSPLRPIEEFIRKNIGEECPFCGHKLHIPPLKVDVYPLKGAGSLNRFTVAVKKSGKIGLKAQAS